MFRHGLAWHSTRSQCTMLGLLCRNCYYYRHFDQSRELQRWKLWGAPPGEPLGGIYSLKTGEWEVAMLLEALGGVRTPRVVGG